MGNGRSKALLLFFVTLALALADLAYYYPHLPDPMASHFDGTGSPNGWMSKSSFALFYLVLLALVNLPLLASAFSLRHLPVSMINLPNKDYWFAPEHEGETRRVLGESMLWMAVITQAFLLAVMHLVFRANLTTPPQLSDSIWIYLIALLGFSLWWSIDLMRRFRHSP